MTTHSLILKATGAVAALALVASLFGFAMATSVQQAHAATMAEQIICYVDQQLGPDLPFDPQVDYCGGDEPAPMLCADGIDNDADGLVDLADPGCSGPTDNSESPDPVLAQCQDTIDNDNDGLVDLNDPDCDSASDNTESGTMGTSTPTTTVQCADTVDNDGDGLIDYPADPGCSSAQDDSEAGGGGGNGTTTPKLTIVKHAMGGNGTFNFAVNGAGTTSLTTVSGWATSSAMTLAIGSSTITEATSTGWTITDISCREGSQAIGTSAGMGAYMFNAADGDDITCTFTNTATSTGTTTDSALHVDSIDAQKTTAIANDTYEDGWRYMFHITAPNDEENLAMRFSDWVSGNSTIPVANNMRVSSAQASSTGAITLTAANTYSTPPMVMMTDLDPSMPGRQVEVLVEVKIPEGTANDTYTTTYGVQTLP